MYKDHQRKINVVVIIMALACVIGLFVLLSRPDDNYQNEAMASIKRSVLERSLQCYVVEGAYPPDLKYLEDNYGLSLNKTDYYIHYEIFAENIPPEVRVTLRRR